MLMHIRESGNDNIVRELLSVLFNILLSNYAGKGPLICSMFTQYLLLFITNKLDFITFGDE